MDCEISIAGILEKIGTIEKDVARLEKKVVHYGANMAVRRAIDVTPPNSRRTKAGRRDLINRIEGDLVGDGGSGVTVKLRREGGKLKSIYDTGGKFGIFIPVVNAKKVAFVRDPREVMKETKLVRGKLAVWRWSQHKERVDVPGAKKIVAEKKKQIGRLMGGWNAGAIAAGVKLPNWISKFGTDDGAAGFIQKNGRYIFWMENYVEYGIEHMERVARYAERRVQAGMLKKWEIEVDIASKNWR